MATAPPANISTFFPDVAQQRLAVADSELLEVRNVNETQPGYTAKQQEWITQRTSLVDRRL